MRERITSTIVAAVAALVLVVIVAGCGSSGSSSTKRHATERFTINVQHGKVQGGLHTLKVESGEHVVITITSDADDEAHLHGIDKEVELTAGTPTKLAFDAKAQGSYELELHGSDTLIATVEVR
jgi:hypothetical protein